MASTVHKWRKRLAPFFLVGGAAFDYRLMAPKAGEGLRRVTYSQNFLKLCLIFLAAFSCSCRTTDSVWSENMWVFRRTATFCCCRSGRVCRCVDTLASWAPLERFPFFLHVSRCNFPHEHYIFKRGSTGPGSFSRRHISRDALSACGSFSPNFAASCSDFLG